VTLATGFTALPEEHVDAAGGTQAAARCRFQLDYRPELDRRTYGRLLIFARMLRETFASLEPADNIDVQCIVAYLAETAS
jgi:hypothetical protein